MNLIDAIKSGKPFRRKCWNGGAWYVASAHGLEEALGDRGRPFDRSDILAEDWEIQEPSVTITRTQFFDMASRAFGAPDGKGFIVRSDEYARIEDLARKLGLEPAA